MAWFVNGKKVVLNRRVIKKNWLFESVQRNYEGNGVRIEENDHNVPTWFGIILLFSIYFALFVICLV